ncbi:MAG: membrane protein insertion efficiency factor YidD [Candidatus Dojkabacteria bacterium]
MRHILMFIIRIYQKTFSYDHGIMGKIFPNTRFCKFTPTCSQYGYEAIEKYGSIKGTILFLKRFVKCNPWTKPGIYDPVP